jgi:hypothetical protein
MMVKDEGSMLGGHSARRKLGGPEMYAVARRALTAGDDEGKRTEKSCVVSGLVGGADLTFTSAMALAK